MWKGRENSRSTGVNLGSSVTEHQLSFRNTPHGVQLGKYKQLWGGVMKGYFLSIYSYICNGVWKFVQSLESSIFFPKHDKKTDLLRAQLNKWNENIIYIYINIFIYIKENDSLLHICECKTFAFRIFFCFQVFVDESCPSACRALLNSLIQDRFNSRVFLQHFYQIKVIKCIVL